MISAVSPAASFSRIKYTGTRVPLSQGFPIITSGRASINSGNSISSTVSENMQTLSSELFKGVAGSSGHNPNSRNQYGHSHASGRAGLQESALRPSTVTAGR